MNSKPRYRTKFANTRWTDEEYAELAGRARQAGMTISDYIRHMALGQKIVPRVDLMWIGELRRIGALLRHNYPSVKSWTGEEKKRYWQTRDQLLEFAARATVTITGKTVKSAAKSAGRS